MVANPVIMSHTTIYIVSTLCLVIIGSLPCRGDKKACTYTAIDDCWKRDYKGPCQHYGAIADCMKTISKDCGDDRLAMKLENEIEANEARSEKCPGMSGQCFSSELLKCQENVPFPVKTQVNLSNEGRKKKCDAFKGKEQGAINCMKKLKSQCTRKHSQGVVEWFIKDIQKVIDICVELDGKD